MGSLEMQLQRSLVSVDALACFILGIALFFAPSYIAQHIFNGQTDGVHWHILRAIGGQLLGSAFILYRLGYCSREVASVSYLIRLLGATLTLVLIYHCSSMTPDIITNEKLKIGKYCCYISMALHLSMLTYSGWP